ncbi:MAG: PilZ domain-containing protein [Synechococcaceae cyanobacterium]|nr:PilZ domain-containing protein [Synechococcaceae cyanobacterium]
MGAALRRLGWALPLLAGVLIAVLWWRQLLLLTGMLSEGSLSLLGNDLAAATAPGELLLLLPTLLAAVLALLLPGLPARSWTRLPLLVLLVLSGARYLVWRLSVLPSGSGLLTAAGALILLAELAAVLTVVLPLLPGLRYEPRRRSREVDSLLAAGAGETLRAEVWVLADDQSPRLVRRALVAAGNLGPALAGVTLIDRRGRPELQTLASGLGVRCVAGSADDDPAGPALLQRALDSGDSDLIAVLTADMVPLGDLLQRTRVLFHNPSLALLQTPDTHFQSECYNRNLGVDVIIPKDREFFYHYLEVVRDAHRAVIACDRAFVLRRSAIVALGGFATAPLGQRLGRRLQAAGWDLAYLDETLCLAEAPRRFAAYLQRRLKAMVAEAAALADSPGGLRPAPGAWILQLHQRLSLAMPLVRVVLVLLPLLALLLGVPLIEAPLGQVVVQALPFLILLQAVPPWLSRGHQEPFWNAVVQALVAVPLLRHLLGRRPAAPGVVPTGSSSAGAAPRQSLSLALSWPFLLLELGLIAVLLVRYGLPTLALLLPSQPFTIQPGYIGEGTLLLWNLANGLLLLVCLLCSIDQPVLRQGDRVPLRLAARLRLGEQELAGVCRDISETGMALILEESRAFPPGSGAELWLEGLPAAPWPVTVVRGFQADGRAMLGLRFEALGPQQEAQLLGLLYRGGLGVVRPPTLHPLAAAAAVFQGLLRANPVLR